MHTIVEGQSTIFRYLCIDVICCPKLGKKPQINELPFIKKKVRWQAYFQGGLAQISEQDYNVITSP